MKRLLEGALGVLIAAECVANALWRGVVFSPDSRFFVRVADEMLRHHWNTVPNKLPVIVYTVLPLLIAAAKTIAPASWPTLIAIVNALATACAGVLAFRLASRHIGTLGGAVVAAGFLLGSDIVDWSRYILTDSLYLGISMLAIYLMIEAVVRQAPRYAVAAGGVIAVALLTRPTAPHLLVPFVFTLITMRRPVRRWTIVFAAALPFVLLAAVAALAFLAQRPVDARRTGFLLDLYRHGVVIVGRPETWTRGGSGFVPFLDTLLHRLGAFFSITAQGFSRRHTIAAALYYVPLYAAAAVGVVALFARRTTERAAEIVAGISFVALCTIWVAQSLVIIDYDWRYRLPALPLLLLLAAFGLQSRRWAPRRSWP